VENDRPGMPTLEKISNRIHINGSDHMTRTMLELKTEKKIVIQGGTNESMNESGLAAATEVMGNPVERRRADEKGRYEQGIKESGGFEGWSSKKKRE